MHRHLRRSLQVVFTLYIALIVLLSLLPRAPGVSNDKLAHLGAYMLMALIGMPLTGTPKTRVRMLLSIIAIGAGLEAVQSIIPGRSASGWDLAADATGAVAGSALWLVVLRLSTALVALVIVLWSSSAGWTQIGQAAHRPTTDGNAAYFVLGGEDFGLADNAMDSCLAMNDDQQICLQRLFHFIHDIDSDF